MIKLFYQIFKNNPSQGFIKNPLFYSVITALIFAIHLLHISLHFSHDNWALVGFGFCLFVESLAEGALLCIIGSKLYHKKYLRYPYVIFAAFLPILHLIDFILERLFSLSIWHSIYSVFSQSLDNFFEMLYATNLPLWTWALGFFLLFCMGFVFIIIHEKTHKIKPHAKLVLNLRYIILASIGIMSVYIPIKKNLFSKETLFTHAANVLPLKNIFAKDKADKKIVKLDDPFFEAPTFVEGNDNLYIFIVESLRNDAINIDSSPCLTELGQKYFRHNFCIAGANGTHLSWYSLFFSQPALMWKKTGNIGSPFLRDLKYSGYKVNVLASARMSYFDMDKQIFGMNQENIDEYYCPKLSQDLTAYEADKACFDYLKLKNQKNEGKQAFIVFLDATHFGYSLPKNPHIKFSPSVDSVPFISTVFSKIDVNGVKNRYLNTVYALDGLFQDFVDDLKNKSLYEQALVMVTSDHGEEFYENGQLFHASHLSDVQLKIPFILKTPAHFTNNLKDENTFSHQDMFPLIRSVLAKKNFDFKDFQIASRFNFSLPPEETVLISRKTKTFYKYNPAKHALRVMNNTCEKRGLNHDYVLRFFLKER